MASPRRRRTLSGAPHDATAAQIALAWVLAQGEDVVPIPGTRRAARVQENAQAAWHRVAGPGAGRPQRPGRPRQRRAPQHRGQVERRPPTATRRGNRAMPAPPPRSSRRPPASA
ncbi:aldo/keto reductase [Herbidospora mongoliensis]|uniref:aldo/keto reductase n=1 Tax=Herbidospora mongoliensis TaxID=688067 RepID=UPI001C3F3ABA